MHLESLQKNRGYFLQELPKTVKNEGKSRKTVIVAKELAVFSARITGMKMSIAKLLENHGRSGLRSVADPTIQKGSLSTSFLGVPSGILVGSYTTGYQKRKSFDFLF